MEDIQRAINNYLRKNNWLSKKGLQNEVLYYKNREPPIENDFNFRTILMEKEI